jgi:hypothetical protein
MFRLDCVFLHFSLKRHWSEHTQTVGSDRGRCGRSRPNGRRPIAHFVAVASASVESGRINGPALSGRTRAANHRGRGGLIWEQRNRHRNAKRRSSASGEDARDILRVRRAVLRLPIAVSSNPVFHRNFQSRFLTNEAPRIGSLPPLRNEFYRAIPVDQLKSVCQIRECLRRCRQGLVNRAVTTFMRIVRLCIPIHFPANEEK